ncbi:hypothetical protein C478_15792 [Natrinema thermotolerans DSM 11552]|nr:hypothetical protein C478_15792 [Natrinema thermotolerans DSM 11552]
MPVWIECDDCGLEGTIPERDVVPGGGTRCPSCGERTFSVRRSGLDWHPDP